MLLRRAVRVVRYGPENGRDYFNNCKSRTKERGIINNESCSIAFSALTALSIVILSHSYT